MDDTVEKTKKNPNFSDMPRTGCKGQDIFAVKGYNDGLPQNFSIHDLDVSLGHNVILRILDPDLLAFYKNQKMK